MRRQLLITFFCINFIGCATVNYNSLNEKFVISDKQCKERYHDCIDDVYAQYKNSFLKNQNEAKNEIIKFNNNNDIANPLFVVSANNLGWRKIYPNCLETLDDVFLFLSTRYKNIEQSTINQAHDIAKTLQSPDCLVAIETLVAKNNNLLIQKRLNTNLIALKKEYQNVEHSCRIKHDECINLAQEQYNLDLKNEKERVSAENSRNALLIIGAILTAGAAAATIYTATQNKQSSTAAPPQSQNNDLRGCCSYHNGVRNVIGTQVYCNDGVLSPTCN